jgi:hypothetical protein
MTKALWAAPAVFVAVAFTAAAQPDVVPAGTQIQVRTNEYINSDHADGRIYTGTVVNDVFDRDGRVVIPRGSQVELVARRYGGNELSLDLDSITAEGRRFVVDASPEQFYGGDKQGVGENRRTGKFVGGGALLGTIVGAIAGGGKGAAIGAVSGAAAGAGAQMATRGREIRIPAETLLTFRLDHGIRVGGPDDGYTRDGYHYHHEYR